MNLIEQLIRGYDKHIGVARYKTMIIDRFDAGKLSLEKAHRLEAKINQWIRVQATRG